MRFGKPLFADSSNLSFMDFQKGICVPGVKVTTVHTKFGGQFWNMAAKVSFNLGKWWMQRVIIAFVCLNLAASEKNSSAVVCIGTSPSLLCTFSSIPALASTARMGFFNIPAFHMTSVTCPVPHPTSTSKSLGCSCRYFRQNSPIGCALKANTSSQFFVRESRL